MVFGIIFRKKRDCGITWEKSRGNGKLWYFYNNDLACVIRYGNTTTMACGTRYGNTGPLPTPGTDSFTFEMHLAVHDHRELPIGWSSWEPKFGYSTVVLPKVHRPKLHHLTQTSSVFRACIMMQFGQGSEKSLPQKCILIKSIYLIIFI